MRLLQFVTRSGFRVGAERSPGVVVDLADVGVAERSVKSLLEGGAERLDAVRRLVDDAGDLRTLEMKDLKLAAPIHDPGKILCVGLNYRDHCLEVDSPIPEQPVIFSKCLNTVTGPRSEIKLPGASQQVDWEVELVFVIGKAGKDISAASAMDHVAGFTVANDVTARDWQSRPEVMGQWLLGKSMDGFCPMGPTLVTKDEIPDPHRLPLRLRVNGVIKQESNTNQLVFDIPYIVSYVSRLMTLQPGDVVLTGTPPGVGFTRNPKEFIAEGDVVQAEIDGIGTIVNKFVS